MTSNIREDIFSSTKTVTLSLGGTNFTGKECVVKSFEICTPTQHFDKVYTVGGMEPLLVPIQRTPAEITVTFLCDAENFSVETFFEDYKPKIRNKKVEDCNIKELLYAVRQKVEENKTGG